MPTLSHTNNKRLLAFFEAFTKCLHICESRHFCERSHDYFPRKIGGGREGAIIHRECIEKHRNDQTKLIHTTLSVCQANTPPTVTKRNSQFLPKPTATAEATATASSPPECHGMDYVHAVPGICGKDGGPYVCSTAQIRFNPQMQQILE